MTAPPWLSGPVAGVVTELQPAAHMLLDAIDDLRRIVPPIPDALIWERPGGAASIGFHMLHLAGSADRLLTYATGAPLSESQRKWLAAEKDPESLGMSGADLLERAVGTLERALGVLRHTSAEELDLPRPVGRAALPSSVRGLLYHVAEHSQRHLGQIATTVKVVQGSDESPLGESGE